MFADGDDLVARATSEARAPSASPRFPLSDDVLGSAYRQREPVVVDDLADVRSACADPATAGPACRSLLCVPFGDDGLLVATSPQPAAFTDDGLDRVTSLVADAEVARARVGASGGDDRLEAIANVLSHDLGSPMTVARGYLELAREGGGDEELDRVAHAIDRIEEIVEGLVSFVRTGEHLGPVGRVELADAARRSWCSTATRDATLDLRDSAVILADGNGLCEVLENLFQNAIAHGGSAVTVAVGLLESGNGFYVEDDGPGIPAGRRAEVFEDGYSATAEGSGFGLGIVRRLADAHGWDVAVTDGSGGGARFEFTGVERPER